MIDAVTIDAVTDASGDADVTLESMVSGVLLAVGFDLDATPGDTVVTLEILSSGRPPMPILTAADLGGVEGWRFPAASLHGANGSAIAATTANGLIPIHGKPHMVIATGGNTKAVRCTLLLDR